jgi:DNA helicase-2/ATP-dependent DNA helicase PcrA
LENTLPNKGAAKQCLCGSPWPQIYSYLAAVQWRPDPNWIWQPVKPKAAPPKYLPTKSLGTYKSHYWADGVIDHDDVLRFAYMLLSEHRELASFLSCRFPYIFVDEFQDTNPVQTEVLRWLAEAGSTIGVIGDPVQSIFLFQGAQPNGFEDFLLAEQDHFQIQNNRRSTDEIVAFINELRKDGLVQEGIRNESGPGALLLIGDQQKAVARAKELCGDNVALVVLARKNDVVAAVRNLGSQVCLVSWNEFQQKDFDRFVFANRLLPCVELARNGHFALAIDGATRAISRRNGTLRKPIECHSGVSEIIARGLAVTIIERALTFPDSMNFSDAYNSLGYAIADNLPGAKLPKIMRGKAEIIAKGIAFNDLVRSMSAVDNVRDARTIHVAKGAQFGAVMVIIEDLDTLARCCDKTFGNGEEERLLYVAFSRARDMLFMQSDEKPPNGLLARLRDMSVSIEHV